MLLLSCVGILHLIWFVQEEHRLKINTGVAPIIEGQVGQVWLTTGGLITHSGEKSKKCKLKMQMWRKVTQGQGRSGLGRVQLTTGGAGARKQAPQQTCPCSSQRTSSFPFSTHLCRCYLNIHRVLPSCQNNCFAVLTTKK